MPLLNFSSVERFLSFALRLAKYIRYTMQNFYARRTRPDSTRWIITTVIEWYPIQVASKVIPLDYRILQRATSSFRLREILLADINTLSVIWWLLMTSAILPHLTNLLMEHNQLHIIICMYTCRVFHFNQQTWISQKPCKISKFFFMRLYDIEGDTFW